MVQVARLDNRTRRTETRFGMRQGNTVRAVIFLIVLLSALLPWPAQGAHAEEHRVALVIGMSKYEQVAALANAANDARALGEALIKLNFDVTSVYDVSKRDLEKTLRNFGAKAAKADVILIFYAGHGVQVDGQNYMIPVDAHLERLDDLPYEAVPLGLFLGAIRNAGSAGLMIVDACRNNPFIEKLNRDTSSAVKIGIGLGRVDDTPSGTLLAMATRANTVAYDGVAQHSPYTQAILEELAIPGIELHLFFGRVADRVKKLTDGKQEPYISGTLGGGSIYLNPKPANHPPQIPAQGAIEVPDSAVAVPLGLLRPTDQDPDDRLTIEITSLPDGGGIRVGGHVLAVGDVLPASDIEKAAFTADGTIIGNGGSLAYRVTDLNGGSAEISVPFKIVTTNRRPAVSKSGSFVAVRNWLGISLPIDPDGDPLTVTVESVPQAGEILDGRKAIARGDSLEPSALPRLMFSAEDAPTGPVGRFSYKVDDGRGGSVESVIDIAVAGDGSAGFTAEPGIPVVQNSSPPSTRNLKGDQAEVTASADSAEPSGDPATFSDCSGCPLMVPITGGMFDMGGDAKRNELPVHKVTIKPFAISKYEITVAEWRACTLVGACAEILGMNADREDAPIRNISWDDARIYVEWLSARTTKKYRLLSEAEWEFAARAGTKTRFWWGDKVNNALVSCLDCGGNRGGSSPPIVRSIKPNAYGVAGASGGVAEWVKDCWKPSYEGAPVDGSPRAGDCSLRVLRGGSWLDDQTHITVTSRSFAEHLVRKPSFGLRVARERGN